MNDQVCYEVTDEERIQYIENYRKYCEEEKARLAKDLKEEEKVIEEKPQKVLTPEEIKKQEEEDEIAEKWFVEQAVLRGICIKAFEKYDKDRLEFHSFMTS